MGEEINNLSIAKQQSHMNQPYLICDITTCIKAKTNLFRKYGYAWKTSCGFSWKVLEHGLIKPLARHASLAVCESNKQLRAYLATYFQ
jgi:hypothetical protein